MREIVLDTETTGFEPADGHRIVEIGCVELVEHMPTGKTYRCYLNPERAVPVDSQRIHGLTDEFLADKPKFSDVVDDLLAFIGDSVLVIHNASFDLKFVNSELHRIGRPPIPYARTVDTIEIAKSKIPGARYSLDELCKRFGIDLTARTKHGALLDAELTSQVYMELLGGRQRKLSLSPIDRAEIKDDGQRPIRVRPTPLLPRLSPAEAEAHARFIVSELGPEPLWNAVLGVA